MHAGNCSGMLMVHVSAKLCNLLHSQLLKHVELSTELSFKLFGAISYHY